jgi:hypothetical protein
MPKPSKTKSKPSSDSDSDDSLDARLREAAVTIDDINKNNEKTIEINNCKNDDNSFCCKKIDKNFRQVS